MKTFQETKEFIVTRATELDACEGQLDRANEAETIEDLLSVIKDNLGWVSNHKLFTWESIQEYFTKEQLLEYNIGNTGAGNAGFSNSGDSNSGYRNSGAFCTNQNPKVFLFDVECSLTVKEWEEHPACRIMQNNLETHLWVPSGSMTDEQKAAWPKHETTGGFLKAISMHDAWKDMWHNLTEDKKALFTSLPHFDPAKFLEITGINVNP